MKQAPKGGVTIAGVFYKGGQFLPTHEPQRGKWNRTTRTGGNTRKAEIAPYVWVEAPEGYRSIYAAIGGIIAKIDKGTNHAEFCARDKTLEYYGYTRETAQALIDRYNNGEVWMKIGE